MFVTYEKFWHTFLDSIARPKRFLNYFLCTMWFNEICFLYFSLRVVDISDEMTDMEMSNNDSDGDKGVIVSEVSLTKRPPALPNNKDSSTRVRLTTQHGQRQSE
jgi:hypothetical protein